jgi:hypothetical protein
MAVSSRRGADGTGRALVFGDPRGRAITDVRTSVIPQLWTLVSYEGHCCSSNRGRPGEVTHAGGASNRGEAIASLRGSVKTQVA